MRYVTQLLTVRARCLTWLLIISIAIMLAWQSVAMAEDEPRSPPSQTSVSPDPLDDLLQRADKEEKMRAQERSEQAEQSSAAQEVSQPRMPQAARTAPQPMIAPQPHDLTDVSSMASGVTGAIVTFSNIITAVSYLCGIVFAISAVIKYKMHRDNPHNIHMSAIVTEALLALVLIFLPFLTTVSNLTSFGVAAHEVATH